MCGAVLGVVFEDCDRFVQAWRSTTSVSATKTMVLCLVRWSALVRRCARGGRRVLLGTKILKMRRSVFVSWNRNLQMMTMLKDLKSRARIQQADAMRQLEVNALVGEVRCKSSLLSCKTTISNYSSLVQCHNVKL